MQHFLFSAAPIKPRKCPKALSPWVHSLMSPAPMPWGCLGALHGTWRRSLFKSRVLVFSGDWQLRCLEERLRMQDLRRKANPSSIVSRTSRSNQEGTCCCRKGLIIVHFLFTIYLSVLFYWIFRKQKVRGISIENGIGIEYWDGNGIGIENCEGSGIWLNESVNAQMEFMLVLVSSGCCNKVAGSRWLK